MQVEKIKSNLLMKVCISQTKTSELHTKLEIWTKVIENGTILHIHAQIYEILTILCSALPL